MINRYEDYRFIFGLANIQYNNKHFEEAEMNYKKCLSLKPTFHHAIQKIANIYCFKWNKDEEAIIWAQKCLEIDNKNLYANLIESLCVKDIQ